MKERIILYFSILIMAGSLLSFYWPVKQGRITSTFGESRGDHFHDGVDLISYSKKVYPVDEGKLLYVWNRKLFPFDRYTGSGNFKVIEHNDLMSVYIHLEDSYNTIKNYKKTDTLGNFANTGRSYGNHIHLGLFKKGSWDSLNAFDIMPQIEDSRPPVIGYFGLHIDNDYILLNNNSQIRLTKHYPLLVKIHDEINTGDRLGIYRLKVIFNDKQVLDIKFDQVKYTDQGLYLNGKKFSDIYDGKDFYKINGIKYQSGMNKCIVFAYDYAGNMATKEFDVTVNLDLE